MKKYEFTKGLHEVKKGIYAYLQPDGGWGYNNTGLVIDADQSLLIDTLFDLILTRQMLDEMNKITDKFDYLVNTHSSGDHYFGNQLVKTNNIITSKITADEMTKIPPQMIAGLVNNAKNMGYTGEYLKRIFGNFKFDGINLVKPTQTFEKELDLIIGNKKVKLIEILNSHTPSDFMVYLPEDKVLFAGDIAFIGVTPIMWQGPVLNYINACNLILGMDVDTIIPGHGPITNKDAIKKLKDYFLYTYNEAKKRHEKGMSVNQAAMDIDLKDYACWVDQERIAGNIFIYYKEFNNDKTPSAAIDILDIMAQYHKAH